MSGKDLNRLQVILTTLFSLFGIAIVSLLYQIGALQLFDNQIYDRYFKWRGPVEGSGKIVLVMMDDRSAKELGRRKGGWSRLQTATALNNLCDAGAEVIGLDAVYFSPDQQPQTDVILANAMAKCNNIVLARTTSTLSGSEKTSLPIFQDAMIGDGFIDLPLDRDEVLRKIRYFNAKPASDGSLQLLPSFSLELARSFLFLDYTLDFSNPDSFLLGGQQDKQIRLPYPELIINFSGDFRSFKNISFADAVNNNFFPSDVANKLIIIGSSLVTDKDSYTTPFSKADLISKSMKDKFDEIIFDVLGQKEYGVVCHALAVETILSNRFITQPSSLLIFVFVLILGIISLLFYIPFVSITIEYIVFFLSLFTVVISGYFLFLEKLIWFEIAPLLLIIIVQFVAGNLLQKTFDKKKTAMVTNLFGKYVSTSVVKELIKGDIDATLQGQRRELTVLFSDLTNFTTMSEELGAKDTSILLNTYFDAMIPLVFTHYGTLDKLMGDAIMAFFGSPLDLPDHADKAALTALAMKTTLESLKNASSLNGINELNLRIGLNTGEATVGNLGSKEFMDYTIIGDSVNLASRLEGLNRVYNTHILVSEFTAEQLSDIFLLRELDLVRVKGKLRAIRLFELMGIRSESEKKCWLADRFTQALLYFRGQNWSDAERIWNEILTRFPQDGPTLMYLGRVTSYKNYPPPENWDGITIFENK